MIKNEIQEIYNTWRDTNREVIEDDIYMLTLEIDNYTIDELEKRIEEMKDFEQFGVFFMDIRQELKDFIEEAFDEEEMNKLGNYKEKIDLLTNEDLQTLKNEYDNENDIDTKYIEIERLIEEKINAEEFEEDYDNNNNFVM